jgi:Flp pilus assembly protein TadB
MARYSSLRASDADREAVVARLQRAATEGRLDHDELEGRLHRALRARSYGDLHSLLADLPTGPAALERSGRRGVPEARHLMVVAARASVVVVAAVVAVALVLAVAALMATAWLVWVVAWFALRSRRGCQFRPAPWARPPGLRRPQLP